MKRMIWKSLGSLLLCLSFLSVYAKEDLVLHLKSGGQITFTLEENPVITFEGENMLVKSKTVNYSVPMGDIDSYDFVTREDPVTITAKDSTIKYGDKIPTFEFTSKGAALDGTPSITCRATKESPVGTYPIVISKGSVTNGNVTYVNGTLTIQKAPLTIIAKDYTIKQGETLPVFDATYVGFKNGESKTVLTKLPNITTTATSASEPGKYKINIYGAEAGNYEIAYVKGTLTIEQKDEPDPEPDPEPEPAYKVGDDITSLAPAEWEGKTADYEGLANPAVERYTHSAPYETGDILTQTLTGLRNGTYEVQLDVAASFTPDRGFTCPTGDELSVVFANETQENLPVVARGWVAEGEQNTVALTTTVTDGTLKYGIKNLAQSGNWFVARLISIVYVSESESVSALVTITADTKSMVYGSIVPSLTYKAEGASLSGTPKLSTTATKTSAVGTYPIKVEKGTVTNTNVNFVNGTITITKAPLTITAKSYTIKQGEALPTFDATYEGFKNGETETVLTKQPTITTTATSASAPGEYKITVSGAEAQNYEMSYVAGKLTIMEATGVESAQENTSKTTCVNGHVLFSQLQTGSKVYVYAVDGRQISLYTADSMGIVDVDLTILPKGIYILKSPDTEIKITNR